VDILQIETRVLSTSEGKRRNLLLVQGMGGAGKTTLVHHLGWWWQSTGLVDEIFHVGDDEKAHTRDQIVDHIARRLWNQAVPPGMAVSPAFAQFQALQPALRQTMLTTHLRAERHLVILDNLESVTGASLTLPNTLSAADQGLVRGLLADLLDGETLVLLGSRGREARLTEGPHAPLRVTDVYELLGLDDEAASTLAERILARRHAPPHGQGVPGTPQAVARLPTGIGSGVGHPGPANPGGGALRAAGGGSGVGPGDGRVLNGEPAALHRRLVPPPRARGPGVARQSGAV
jgi:hypothetical protein